MEKLISNFFPTSIGCQYIIGLEMIMYRSICKQNYYDLLMQKKKKLKSDDWPHPEQTGASITHRMGKFMKVI